MKNPKGSRGENHSEAAYSSYPDFNPTAKDHSLAIISMIGYGIRQPARLVIQAVVLRDQPHSNGAPDATVHDRYLKGQEQDTVHRKRKLNKLVEKDRKNG